MRKIALPGAAGTVIFTGTDEEADEHERILRARFEFTRTYCRERGWPEEPTQLSIAQILEIGEQPGWKKP